MHDEWLKFKKYPHIGKPLTYKKDSVWVKAYVTDPKKIEQHKFTPLLHRTLSQRKFRPEEASIKNPSRKRSRCFLGIKTRHIYYPSHLDSIIYSYYNYKLIQAYEKYLADKHYKNVAVAYRKIPNQDGRGNKCNIEFAYEAIKFIESNRAMPISVIVADVTSFFDNLDHQLLYNQWKRVLNVEFLRKDHYSVYKSLVNYSYVHENELFKRFSGKLIVERSKPNNASVKELKRKKVSKIYNARHENVVAFCDSKEFFREATDLIRTDKPFNRKIRRLNGKNAKKGIPQGTPISATLANIYMLDFDEQIYEMAISKKAYYQRYSDDLIIICNQQDESYFYSQILNQIQVKSKLDIQKKKTNLYRYVLNENNILTGGILQNGIVQQNKQLEYLGFMYNGTKVRVKTVSFSKFYRKMKRSFRRGVHFAKAAHIPSEALFERRLYKKYTHLGAMRRLKWIPNEGASEGYKCSKEYDWGNFISYLNKADSMMNAINGDKSIAKQYRKVWNKFHKVKKYAYLEIKAMKGKSN